MTAKSRHPLDLAEVTAAVLVKLLAPACERIEVAGSVRRGRLDVGDIELLAVPSPGQRDLFGRPVAKESLLDQRCLELVQGGHLDYRPNRLGHRTFGPLNKLMVHCATGIPVDILSATPENWGMALLVRTGPAEFNKKVMARFLSLGMEGHAYGGVTKDGKAFACPTEEDVFDLLGWEYQWPESRGLVPVRQVR